MPWKEVSVMSQRRELVMLAQAEGSNIAELSRRYGVSRVTAYKWMNRFRELGEAGLAERSKRPHCSPSQTCQQTEEAILDVRDAHPAWGPRKIRSYLLRRGHEHIPSPSTIEAILRRNGRIMPAESAKHRPWQRFERAAPNELWQMDFKGHFAIANGRCHPLTVLDDHSRYAVGIQACANEQGLTVKDKLTPIFRRYGLPESMLMDNGRPWGFQGDYTSFEVWLMRLGVGIYHGRPFHPQTQGKDERFHRTLVAEVLMGKCFGELGHCQKAFDAWREVYNWERPHEALGMDVPGSAYAVSNRAFPENLPDIVYGPDDVVRRVQDKGHISFHAITFSVGAAFKGLPVALRPTTTDGIWDVFFMTHPIAQIDLNNLDVGYHV